MMNEHFASGLTNEQLKAEILRQGRKANLRLSQLKKKWVLQEKPYNYGEMEYISKREQNFD